MKKPVRFVYAILAALLGIGIALMGAQSASAAATSSSIVVSLIPPGCGVTENLDSTANDYIEKCRKASVRNEFPSEYFERTLAQIKVDRTTKGRKAWKLLTDSRFAKP